MNGKNCDLDRYYTKIRAAFEREYLQKIISAPGML
jgi:hypothetical protein